MLSCLICIAAHFQDGSAPIGEALKEGSYGQGIGTFLHIQLHWRCVAGTGNMLKPYDFRSLFLLTWKHRQASSPTKSYPSVAARSSLWQSALHKLQILNHCWTTELNAVIPKSLEPVCPSVLTAVHSETCFSGLKTCWTRPYHKQHNTLLPMSVRVWGL